MLYATLSLVLTQDVTLIESPADVAVGNVKEDVAMVLSLIRNKIHGAAAAVVLVVSLHAKKSDDKPPATMAVR